VWISIELIAASACLACAVAFPPPFGVVAGLIVFVAITLPNTARRLSHTRLTARFYENVAYRDVKCKDCTVGSQYYDKDKGWGPIPIMVRMARKGSVVFHPGQSNIRRCSSCHGLGRLPQLKPGAISRERLELRWPPPDGVPYAADSAEDEDC
jgi:hypothetical protein